MIFMFVMCSHAFLLARKMTILISFLILSSNIIVIFADHSPSLLDDEAKLTLDKNIRARALHELSHVILPHSPTSIVSDFFSFRQMRPNITLYTHLRVNESKECHLRPVHGIFTYYHRCEFGVAIVDVDWSNPITCPHNSCKVEVAFSSSPKSPVSNKSPLGGMKGWKVTDSSNGVEAGINEGQADLQANELSGVNVDESGGNACTPDKYEFILDQNKTLVAVTAVAGITCRRTPYEMLDVLPQKKFDLFNINVSKCGRVQNGTGCLTHCEHLVVSGVTPQGLGRYAHRMCWWDFRLSKIFVVRKNPMKLCDYFEPTEWTVPLRHDGTFFKSEFWFERSCSTT